MSENNVAIALGFFDGVHIGHQAVIKSVLEQRKNGLNPCVFTFKTSGATQMSKSGIITIQTAEEKETVLKKMGVDTVYSPNFDEFKNMSPKEFIEEILIKKYGAKYIACGYDFHFGKGATGTVDDLREIAGKMGVKVDIVPAVLWDGEPISSTKIRKAINEGDIKTANSLLGRPFSIKSEIIHGKKLGRTISFPTINQRFNNEHIVPKFGVYATILNLRDGRKVGATNVGIKPTVSENANEILAETFIVNFSGEIYGEAVEVEFYEFIRAEKKFSSIDELKEEISKNSVEAVELCEKYL